MIPFLLPSPVLRKIFSHILDIHSSLTVNTQNSLKCWSSMPSVPNVLVLDYLELMVELKHQFYLAFMHK
jgi:hypothetical protein